MKNTIKKGLSLVLACMLIMSMSAIAVLAEGDAVTIAMGYVTGEVGQQVVVPVTIGENSNVASASFAIDFDSTQLKFVEATEGTVALSYYEVGVTADNANQIGVAFIGEDLGAVDAAGGTLFNLVFVVKADATEPVTNLDFNFDAVRETDEPGLFDVDNTELTYQVTNGAVVTGVEADVMVSLGEVTGAVGETVSVPVTVTEDSYIVSGAFTVAYDSDNLAFVDYTAGDIAEVTQVEVDNVADGASEVGVIFSTQNTATPITAAGTIVYINFTILEGAVDSNLTINLVHPTDETANGGVATADGDVEGAAFVGGRVVIGEEVEPEPTTTTVTFNVTPADATVEFNGETKTAVDGVATFENVEFGTLAYTVSKEGYVSQSANIEVVADMAAVEVVLEAEVVEPPVTDVPTPTVTVPSNSQYSAFTKEAYYDAETQTIIVRGFTDYDDSTYTYANISFEGTYGATLTTTTGMRYSKSTGNFFAYREKGLSQTATIKYGDYTYNILVEFVDDPTCVNFQDLVTWNVEKIERVEIKTNDKVISLQADRYATNAQSSGAAFALIPEKGATVTYRYDTEASTQKYDGADGFVGYGNIKGYVSYKTGEIGKYEKVKMPRMYRATGSNYIYVTLTKGEYSTEYRVTYHARDFAYSAEEAGVDVNIKSILPRRLFEDSVVIDNVNKTIYFEASMQEAIPTAGFGVEVDNALKTRASRPRSPSMPVSGYNLTGSVTMSAEERELYERFVFTKKVSAMNSPDYTYSYQIKVFGGEDGLAYQFFTVTVKWIDEPLPTV